MKVDIIPITSIAFGTRERKEYGDLRDMIYSIESKGIIQPLTVRKTDKYEEPYELIAGGRRFTAITKAKKSTKFDPEKIPVRIYEDISDYEFKVIELEENLQRLDLTFHEKITMQKKIHDMYVEMNTKTHESGNEICEHTIADTARNLNIDRSTLSKDLSLYNTMQRFPEFQLDKCKNAAEARKKAKKLETLIVSNIEAGKAIKKFGNKKSLTKNLIDKFILDDFFEGVKKIDKNSIDVVEMDPPYAIDLHRVKKDGETTGYNEISEKDYPEFLARAFAECYRVMKPNSWIVCWHAYQYTYLVKDIMNASKFRVANLPLVWTKPGNGQNNNPTKQLSNCFELAHYACKGDPVLNRPGQSNVFPYRRIARDVSYHPTQRPVELITDILSIFGMENSTVMIPFLGSGASLLSASVNKMHAFGFEKSPIYKDHFIVSVSSGYGKEVLDGIKID